MLPKSKLCPRDTIFRHWYSCNTDLHNPPHGTVGVQRQASSSALARPSHHDAPPVFNVISSKAIDIHNLTGTVIHNFMPKVSITPPFSRFNSSTAAMAAFQPSVTKTVLRGRSRQRRHLRISSLPRGRPASASAGCSRTRKKKRSGIFGIVAPQTHTWFGLVQVRLIDLDHTATCHTFSHWSHCLWRTPVSCSSSLLG